MKLFEQLPNVEIFRNEESFLSAMRAECGQALKEFKMSGKLLFRGASGAPDMFRSTPFRQRRPTDSPAAMHEIFTKLMSLAGMVATRSNSIFCTADKRAAEDYGDPYIIIPTDGFFFSWSSQVRDLYHDIFNHLMFAEALLLPDHLFKSLTQQMSVVGLTIHRKCHMDPLIVHDELCELGKFISDVACRHSYNQDQDYIDFRKHLGTFLASQKQYYEALGGEMLLSPTQLDYLQQIYTATDIKNVSPELAKHIVCDRYHYSDEYFTAALQSGHEITLAGEYYSIAYSGSLALEILHG